IDNESQYRQCNPNRGHGTEWYGLSTRNVGRRINSPAGHVPARRTTRSTRWCDRAPNLVEFVACLQRGLATFIDVHLDAPGNQTLKTGGNRWNEQTQWSKLERRWRWITARDEVVERCAERVEVGTRVCLRSAILFRR